MDKIYEEIYDTCGIFDDSVLNAVIKDDSNKLYSKESIANESEIGFIIAASTDAKLADKYFLSAKKKFKYGDKEGAVKMMTDARDLYTKCLQNARDVGGKNKASYKIYKGIGASTAIRDLSGVVYGHRGDMKLMVPKDYTDIYEDNSINIVIRHFKLRINKCDVYLLAFNNEMDKPKYKELSKEIDTYDKELRKMYRLYKVLSPEKLKKYISEHNM